MDYERNHFPSPLKAVFDAAAPALQAAQNQITNAAESAWKAVEGTTVYKRVQDKADQIIADYRWGSRTLAVDLRVPISSEMDERLMLTLAAAAARAAEQIHEHGEHVAQPVTCALVASMLGAFLMEGGLPLRKVCMSPYAIIELKQYKRLITCGLAHMDATHLISNLTAAVPECIYLERTSGSARFAAELAALTLLSHGLFVGWAWFSKEALGDRTTYFSVGAIGASSLAFALQVVAGERRGPVQRLLGTGPLPSQFAWAPQLILTTIVAPGASFPGHMCGVVGGLVYVYFITPVLNFLTGDLFGGKRADETEDEGAKPIVSAGRGQDRQFWGAGTTGGASFGPNDGRVSEWRRQRWWRRWGRDLLCQASLVATSCAVFVLVTREMKGRRPINMWPMSRGG